MKILIVDAGNYCRSPAAEAVCRALAQRAGLGRQVTFGSAGLKDKHAGDTADARTIAACSTRPVTTPSCPGGTFAPTLTASSA